MWTCIGRIGVSITPETSVLFEFGRIPSEQQTCAVEIRWGCVSRDGSPPFGSCFFRSDAIRPAFFECAMVRSGSVRYGSVFGSGRFRNSTVRFGRFGSVSYSFLEEALGRRWSRSRRHSQGAPPDKDTLGCRGPSQCGVAMSGAAVFTDARPECGDARALLSPRAATNPIHLSYLVLRAHMLPHFVIHYHMSPHIAHICP